jgi:integrase
MAVYKLKHRDSWIARLMGPNGRTISKTFTRKTDAVRWEAEQLAARERGELIDPRDGRVSLRVYFDEWSQRQIWELGTQRAMDLAVRTCTFSDAQLRKIRRSHVEAWVKQMATDLAPGTVKTRFNNVRNVLRAAVRDRMIASDPSEGIQLPRQRRRETAMEIPTVEEVARLLDAASDDFRVYLGLCGFAGLRLGEAAAVQVRDIDFLRRTLRVRRQVQRAGGPNVEIRAPKYGSERDIFLPDDLLKELSVYIARKELTGQPEAWLFTGQTGDLPPHQNTVGVTARRTWARAKLTGYTLHDLRHFFASALIASGCDVVTVQRAMGHSSATTTLRTYAHLWPTAEDRTRNAAADLMASVRDASRKAI